jgi:hypothetical protein
MWFNLLIFLNIYRSENPRVPSSILGPATNDIKYLAIFCRPIFKQFWTGITQG